MEASMQANETNHEKSSVEELEFTTKTAKRAWWECFEFSVEAENQVRVRNTSYAEPAEHEYTVTIEQRENGTFVPFFCSCPAFQYNTADDESCKHIVAVAARPVVMVAAFTFNRRAREQVERERPLVTDGGQVIVENGTDQTEETGCVNDEEWCPGIPQDATTPADVSTDELPCWNCWCYWSETTE